MDSGTMRLPKELLSLMLDGGDLGVQCFTKAKTCFAARHPGVSGLVWNDSRCSEKAGKGVHTARVPLVFAFGLYGFELHTHRMSCFYKRYQP